MQWNKKPCPYLKTVVRQIQTQEQTQEVRLPEEMPDVGRILCLWGQSVIRSKQWGSDSISAMGGVSATVMYLPEDGSFPRTMEVWLPFQTRWSMPQTQREGTMRVQCRIKSMDARILSARKMMVRASINVLAEAMEAAQAEICVPMQMPQQVQLLTQVYPAMLPAEGGEKLFFFEDDLHLPQGSKLVCMELLPEIGEKSVVGGRVVLRGSGQLHYVYMDEEGKIHSGQQEIPFAQFAELDREYEKEATVDVMLAVSGLEPEVTDEGIHVQCSLMAQYVVWDRMLLEVVEDAYSPTCPVEISTEELQLPMELDSRVETVDIPCQFREGKVLNVTFLPDHPREFREGEQVSLNLSGAFQILYEDAEGNLQTNVENWSEEMALPVAVDAQVNAMIIGLEMQEPGLNVRIKLGLQTKANQSIPMVTELTMGEQTAPDENRPSLILRPMDEDSLWKMAKKSGSTMDAIRRANHLTQDPQRGQMLLIPIG